MKIYAILVYFDGTHKESVFNLTDFNWFQRSSVKEFILFFSNKLQGPLVQDLEGGLRSHKNIYTHDIYTIYSNKFSDKEVMFVCSDDYPENVAFIGISNIHRYLNQNSEQIRECLDKAIIDYQTTSKVDKIIKIQEDLDKTITIVSQTISSVLERGQQIDKLVQDSNELSTSSKLFYTKAKDNNKCCLIM